MSIEQEHPSLLISSVGVGLSLVVGTTWTGWLPPLVAATASGFAIAWYAIQIWESQTVKRWRRAAGLKIPADIEEQ